MTTTTTSTSEIELLGCSPEPLAAYLKALGVFRIVAEQKDRQARASWRNDVFILHTSLDQKSLTGFFMNEYTPTPVIAPWNNRYKTGLRKGDKEGMDVIRSSNAERLSEYRDVIEKSQQWLEGDKNAVLEACRNELPNSVLPWLDAAFVLTSDDPKYPPLTSAGGTLGTSASGETSMNFMKNLVSALALVKPRGRQTAVDPQEWLTASIFDDESPPLLQNTSGQYYPGAVGGPNAETGFEGKSLTNPWDFVLMIEGAVLFAGAAARRLSSESRVKAAFPFTVDTSAAGFGTSSDSEYQSKGIRGEMWLPLWKRPVSYSELVHVVSEGRAQLGKRQVATGADFARALTGLGVERGIKKFQRFGFLQRSGKDGVIATPLGRLRVREDPKADLLFDLDHWLTNLRAANRSSQAPEGLGRVIRGIEGAIMEFCARGEPRYLQNVLVAVGRAEAWLSKSKVKERIRPLYGLRPEWLSEADDGTAEFRLASALASIQGWREVGPIRVNLEPVNVHNLYHSANWADDDSSVVWHGGRITDAMSDILQRRCMEARMYSLDRLPLYGKIPAFLEDIALFLKEGRLNDRRIADLLLSFTTIDWSRNREIRDYIQSRNPPTQNITVPNVYATLKLTLLSQLSNGNQYSDEDMENEDSIPSQDELQDEITQSSQRRRPEHFDPSVVPLLRAGRANEAFGRAAQRLQIIGLRPRVRQAVVPYGIASRIAAALLIPIGRTGESRLRTIALIPSEDNE